MLKRYGILAIMVFFSYQAIAQKNIETQNILWTRYLLKFQVSERWTPFIDVEERMYMFPFRQHQFLPSVGTNYKLDNSFSLSASFMYFEMILPQDPEADFKELFQEIRPQIALNFKHKIDDHWTFLSRLKFEWRYIKTPLQSDFAFRNYRLRMRMGMKYAFNEKWDASILEEIHFNIGSSVLLNVFDQNRLTFGLNHNINSNFSIETGYLYWFQQRITGIDFFSRNIVYFTLKHNIRFR